MRTRSVLVRVLSERFLRGARVREIALIHRICVRFNVAALMRRRERAQGAKLFLFGKIPGRSAVPQSCSPPPPPAPPYGLYHRVGRSQTTDKRAHLRGKFYLLRVYRIYSDFLRTRARARCFVDAGASGTRRRSICGNVV